MTTNILESNTTTPTNKGRRAVIYCRVSDKKQASEGSGLESQEHRCREYAVAKGYEVAGVFPDDITGEGDFMKRKGMVALLNFLDAYPDESFIIIFDDLKRYTRDVVYNRKLTAELTTRNAVRECLNFKLDASPEGEFIETIIAAQGELERKQGQRQVIQKMKARVEQGYWVFRYLAGYKYKQTKKEGKVLVRDEPVASIVAEALEGFAAGHFASQMEVARFLESQPEFPQAKARKQHIRDLLTHPLYAGYVQAPSWNVSLRKGRHEGLISLETFEKIQRRLKDGARAPNRNDVADEFALRGFVTCGDCATPLRSCMSRSKSGKRHPYYLCQTKSCASYGKSIRRDVIEGEFETLLKDMRPSASLFRIMKDMIINVWNQRLAQAGEMHKVLRRDILKLENQIDTVMDKLVETSSANITKAYERKIEQLEREKLLTSEKLENSFKPRTTAPQVLEHCMRFLSNPWKLWASGDIELRRLLLRLALAEPIAYHRFEGYRTPKTTLPFNILEGICGNKEGMVGPEGFEPPTKRL